MATYKVPQDVEADDKLIGFLSLKQFIFVLLGFGFGYLTFIFFTKVHPVASVVWILPMTICFVLGLYQRKDQPVEVFLASAIRFKLKPHKRKWDQEGYEERVIITAPPKIERNYTKNLTNEQVTSHLGALSSLMDSRGWASKLNNDWQNPTLADTAASDRLLHAEDLNPAEDSALPNYAQPVDVQDESNSPIARDFEVRIQQSSNEAHRQALLALQQARQEGPEPRPTSASTTGPTPVYSAYPTMVQKTVTPASANDPATATAQVTNSAASGPAQSTDQAVVQTDQQPQIQPVSTISTAPASTTPTPVSTTSPSDSSDASEEVEISLH